MSPFIVLPLIAIVGYLIGGIDFAVIVAKSKGVDIYSVGSGNPGTSNVMRTLGKGAAATVLFGDLLKGTVAAYLGYLFDGNFTHAAIVGVAAIVGHCFPALHKFKGGKGVATFFGVVLLVSWQSFLIMAAAWVLVIAFSRKASIASLTVVAIAIPTLWFTLAPDTGPFWWLLAGLVLVVYRHKSSILRIAAGDEHEIGAEADASA